MPGDNISKLKRRGSAEFVSEENREAKKICKTERNDDKRSLRDIQTRKNPVISIEETPPKVIVNNHVKCGKIPSLDELNYKYEIYLNNNNYLGLFIQDDRMQLFYQYHHTFVCIDIMQKKSELNKIWVLFFGIHKTGHSELISVGLFKSINADGFVWICDMFKNYNPCWTNTKIFLTHASIDRKLLSTVFPGKVYLTSFYHCVIRIKEDLCITHNAVDKQKMKKILDIFKNMFISKESGYEKLLKQMKLIDSEFYRLFEKKWHLKYPEWALGLHTDNSFHLGEFFSHISCIRKRINRDINSQETFENIVKKLHEILYKMRK